VRLRLFSVAALVVVSLPVVTASALPNRQEKRLADIKAMMDDVQAFHDSLSADDRVIFSSGAQNLFQAARKWPAIEARLRDGSLDASQLKRTWRRELLAPAASGIQVSNPAHDLFLAQSAGYTQSETSTAWCGNNVVVGYNDSGSFLESLVLSFGGLSFNGLARSTNRGASFTDLKFLNPGPSFSVSLGGDPVVGCTSPTTFYYASLYRQPGLSGISVSKSTNGGLTFAAPVPAALKPITHFLDKNMMAVDPTGNRVYVTYTDFDNSMTSPACPARGRVAIELVRSNDGGATWDPPVVIDEVCRGAGLSFPFVQGSQVAVGPDGEVHVAWERYDDFNPAGFNDNIDREIRARKSTDNGASFAPFVKVADVFPTGDAFALRGGFRTFLDIMQIAVDRSSTPSRGDVYVAFHDGGAVTTPDVFSQTGVYGYADAMVSRSPDGGATWDPPVKVNDNVELAMGTDQYQPGVAVDKDGRVASCFYDRRADPANFTIEYFCAVSTDGGQTWGANERQNGRPFAPIHGTDGLINPVYMGDYDQLANEFTLTHRGFVGTFSQIGPIANPDVKANQIAH
jgi:hypothetical protein